MKVFTCTTFTGHYPVGAAAVVVAEDKEAALPLLVIELQRVGLAGMKADNNGPTPLTFSDLREIPLVSGTVSVLVDGNY